MITTMVTGGAGYIASRLVPELVRSGRRVVVVDSLLYGQKAPQSSNDNSIAVRKIDINYLTLSDLSGIDEVIDLAAISNESVAERHPMLAWGTNDAGRRKVAALAARAGVRRYILPSSSNVYGAREDPYSEIDDIEPASVYSKANASAERGVLKLASPTFSPLVLRQATVFGWAPEMRYDLVVNAMAADLVMSGVCNVMGDGSQIRPFIWLDDLVEVYLAILNEPPNSLGNAILNVGSAMDQFPVSQIPKMLGQAYGKPAAVAHYGELDKLSHRLDCTKVDSLLGRSIGPSFGKAARILLREIAEYPEGVEVMRSQRRQFTDLRDSQVKR
ncbi:NAD-dependent epimerase/dehydratase family protein [Nocardia sp. NPDC057663]|uniref:NAD-dependent epimerase/dehydratase family protein n=1 Tax=Nocardia sp. NPDC057663 TaxID=3346201 RepID=UPI003672B7BD